ncbi:hypothetical protein GGF32_000439 [Allomyces javanicus]|nr:hypothetical protein GGF32_000439 [Allomyces javanicus]
MDRDDARPPPARLPSPRHHPPPAASPHASPSAPGTPSSATATDDDDDITDDENASIAHPADAPPLPPAKRARHHRSALDSLPAALARARTLADDLSPLPESGASHPTVRAAADELEALIPHITHTFATAPSLRVRAADVRSWIGTLQQTLSVDVMDAAPADLVLHVADAVDQVVQRVGAADVADVWAIALLDIAQVRVEEQAEWMSDTEWCLVRAVDWVHWVLHAEPDPDRLVSRTTTAVDRLLTLEATLHNDVLTLPSSTRPYLLHLILSLLHHTWYTAHRAAAHSPTFQHHWASTLKLLATDTDDLDLAHAALQRARMAVLLRSRTPAASSPSVDDHLLYARCARLVAKLARSAMAGHATSLRFQLGETDPAKFDDMAAVEYRKVLVIDPGHRAARKGLAALGRATAEEKASWVPRSKAAAGVVAVRPVRVPRVAEVRAPVVAPLWPVEGEEEEEEEDPDFEPGRADGEEDELSDVTSSEGEPAEQDDLADVAMDDDGDLDSETMDLDLLLDEYLHGREVEAADGGGGGGAGGGGEEDEVMAEGEEEDADDVTVGDASEDEAMVEDRTDEEERAAAIWHGGQAG